LNSDAATLEVHKRIFTPMILAPNKSSGSHTAISQGLKQHF